VNAFLPPVALFLLCGQKSRGDEPSFEETSLSSGWDGLFSIEFPLFPPLMEGRRRNSFLPSPIRTCFDSFSPRLRLFFPVAFFPPLSWFPGPLPRPPSGFPFFPFQALRVAGGALLRDVARNLFFLYHFLCAVQPLRSSLSLFTRPSRRCFLALDGHSHRPILFCRSDGGGLGFPENFPRAFRLSLSGISFLMGLGRISKCEDRLLSGKSWQEEMKIPSPLPLRFPLP